MSEDDLANISTKLYKPAHTGDTVFDIPVSDLYDAIEELQRLRSITSEMRDLLE